MLYQAILLKNHQFDNSLVSSRNISSEEITEFLDKIKTCIIYISDPSDFRNTCVIFRKWKSLLLKLHDQYYSPMIDSIPNDSGVEFALSNLKIRSVAGEYIDEEQKKDISLFSSNIDPYGKNFYGDIKNIDSNFYHKYSATQSLQAATALFKESKLDDAYEEFFGVTEYLTNKEHLDAIEIYFCSWALHGLGNIAYVKNQYHSANSLFRESLKMKNWSQEYPKILSYLTKSKVAATSISECSAESWNEELNGIYSEFKSDHEILLSQNPELTNNLEMNLFLNIGKSYVYLDNYSTAGHYLSKAMHLSRDLRNPIGEIRCRIFYSIVKGGCDGADEIKIILSKLESSELHNPYLRKIANDTNIAEIETLSPSFGGVVKSLLDEYGVTPLGYNM